MPPRDLVCMEFAQPENAVLCCLPVVIMFCGLVKLFCRLQRSADSQ